MMSRLVEVPSATIDEPIALQDVSDFVKRITRAMKAIAQLYVNVLDDDRLDTDMLLGLLYLGAGSARSDLESQFGFAICAPSKVFDQLIDAGFVVAESNDILHPTAETQAIFRRLSRLAQEENLRWREQLQNVPGGSLVLDDFLTMLRTSQHD